MITSTKRAFRTDKRIPALAGIHIFLLLAVTWPAVGQPAPSTEYQVKAACLLNFAQFIQWPSTVFPEADAPIVVGVLGDDPFGAMLEQTFKGELIQGRKLLVKKSQKLDDLKTCQMLFICKSETGRLPEILTGLKDSAIVTVGETDRFAHQGGIINFYLDSKKIRFEINAEAAQARDLKISSQLLARARIVSSGPGKDKA